MKSRGQRSGVRCQGSGVGVQELPNNPYPITNIKHRKRGFTLVELLLATALSVMVFFAMGTLLTKCYSLWKDATANWWLAQYSRIARSRILCGGFTDPAGGLLAATNAISVPDGSWDYVEYKTVANTAVVQQVYGWKGDAEQDLWLNKDGTWAYGQAVAAYPANAAPAVKADSFVASVSNDVVNITYRLRLSTAGKTFTQRHTINATLVNKE